MGRRGGGSVLDTKSRIARKGQEFAKSREWTKVDIKSYLSYKKNNRFESSQGEGPGTMLIAGWEWVRHGHLSLIHI